MSKDQPQTSRLVFTVPPKVRTVNSGLFIFSLARKAEAMIVDDYRQDEWALAVRFLLTSYG